jgi:hypothetical protein
VPGACLQARLPPSDGTTQEPHGRSNASHRGSERCPCPPSPVLPVPIVTTSAMSAALSTGSQRPPSAALGLGASPARSSEIARRIRRSKGVGGGPNVRRDPGRRLIVNPQQWDGVGNSGP